MFSMNPEENNVTAPNVSDEEMKMPETAVTKSTETQSTAPLNGIIIFILITLLVFILGGLYVWFTELTLQDSVTTQAVERPSAEMNNEPESTTAEAAVETQAALSTSDEIQAIEADLEATDLDGIDAELNAIDAELDAAMAAS